MVESWLPYGKSEVHVSIPIKDLIRVAEPSLGQRAQNPFEAIAESLKSPIGGRPLGETLRSGASVALAIDGSMEPQLAVAAVSAVNAHLRSAGVPLGDEVVLVGSGGRERGNNELVQALQRDLSQLGVKVIEHLRGPTNLSMVGSTSRKTKLEVSSHYASAAVHIAIGEVILDPYTGFGGAQNVILPGLSSLATIEANRIHVFDERAAPGVTEGNPLLADVMEAAQMAGVDLAVNLVMNPRGELLKAYSGGLEESWRKAVSELGDFFRASMEANADVIVVSAGGIKFDFDLYHAAWALRNISQVSKKGATIILLAECSEGPGAEGLVKLSHIDILSELKRRYILGGEAVHLIKSRLRSNEVILVSALPNYFIEPLGLTVAKTVNEAYESATKRHRGRDTLVVTHGCSTLPLLEGEEGNQGQDDHRKVEEGE